MGSELAAVTFDAQDPWLVARFWAAVLDRSPTEDSRGVVLPGSPTQVGLRFSRSSTPRRGANRMHLHLTSTSPDDQDVTVARLLALGGSRVDVGQRPEEGHVVLGDPEGNELCVIEPGNRWLAGCGFLGEVACDGSREVGLFWREVLGWPLVWDEGGETAVQAPDGGTKLAWGGGPVTRPAGRPRQRFELVCDDVDAESARLVALGARPSPVRAPGTATLLDPDGAEFDLVAGAGGP